MKWLFGFMNIFVFLNIAQAAPIELESFALKAAQFSCNREPMTPQYECKDYVGRVATEFNLRLLDVGYWRNDVHTEGIEAAVKTVGWRWELGIRVAPWLEAFHEHHSRHVMDETQPWIQGRDKREKFPVEDSYGIRLKFYINPTPARSVF